MPAGPQRNSLELYVAAREGKGNQAEQRALLVRAKGLFDAKAYKSVTILLDDTTFDAGTIPAIDAFTLRGRALKAQWKLAEACAAYLAAAESAEALGWQRAGVEAFRLAGYAAYDGKDFRGTRRAWEGRLRCAEALQDGAATADALNDLAVPNNDMGALPRSADALERAVGIYRGRGEKFECARALMNLSVAHARLGQFSRALTETEEALALLTDSPAPKRWQTRSPAPAKELAAVLRMNRGNVLWELRDFEEARGEYAGALEIFQELATPGPLSDCYGNLTLALLELNRLEEAEDIGNKALAFFEKRKDDLRVAQALGHLAQVVSRRGAHADAISYQKSALARLRTADDPVETASAAGALGRIYEHAGRAADAETAHREALAKAREAGAQGVEVEEWAGLARTLGGLGKHAETLEAAEKALEKLDTITAGLGEGRTESTWVALPHVFETGVTSAAALRRVGSVWRFVESGRARSLGAVLGGREGLWSAVVPEALAAEEQSARSGESDASDEWLQETDREKKAERRKALEAAQKATLRVIRRIQDEAAAAANLVYPRPAELAAVRANLKAGDALVEYALYESTPLAIVVRKDGERIVPLQAAAEIASAADLLVQQASEGEETPALAELAKAVVTPLALGADVTRVLVSPDRALAGVPFVLLFPGKTVVLVPSGTVLGLLRGVKAAPATRIVAVGNPNYTASAADPAVAKRRKALDLRPLPGAEAELKAIGADVVLKGDDATEARLRKELPAKGPRLKSLHFGCHCLVDATQPRLSALALTVEGSDDGLLTGIEILRMKIDADLVVLSACQTGQGKAVQGDGLLGLARAFMFAGASRVVASLWKVDDAATSELMTRFYGHLKAGKPPAEALRLAQEGVRGMEAWKAPRYWSGWVLWGLPD